MLKNFDFNSDTEVGHMCSGRVFRGVHLENLFKQNFGDEGFYSGEEADLIDEEHSEPTRAEEEEAEELFQNEPETSGTAQTTEVSNINPSVISEMLSNQNILNHQSSQTTITSSSASTQT
jgi:hypothetical protein